MGVRLRAWSVSLVVRPRRQSCCVPSVVRGGRQPSGRALLVPGVSGPVGPLCGARGCGLRVLCCSPSAFLAGACGYSGFCLPSVLVCAVAFPFASPRLSVHCVLGAPDRLRCLLALVTCFVYCSGSIPPVPSRSIPLVLVGSGCRFVSCCMHCMRGSLTSVRLRSAPPFFHLWILVTTDVKRVEAWLTWRHC